MTDIVLPCGRVTQIDDGDIQLLDGFRLHAEKRGRTFYVRARKQGQRGGGKYLHNIIMGGRADHRDSDGLNNKRSNLRCCTQAQNGLNRSPKEGKRFKGVYFDKRRGSYYAQVSFNRSTRTVSGLASEEDAARAHDKMAREMHGEWARLNFPEPAFRWLDRIDGRQGELGL